MAKKRGAAPATAARFKFKAINSAPLRQTAINVDLIEFPEIKPEQLPTTDTDKLKKTVFAVRKVRVRITIDEKGDVTGTKALNGHTVLRESPVEAAKKSLFAARK